jgi:hypothetical protein
MIGIRGPWIFGVIVLTVLVFLHWLAYRVGEKRQKAKLARQGGAREFKNGGGYDPIAPK